MLWKHLGPMFLFERVGDYDTWHVARGLGEVSRYHQCKNLELPLHKHEVHILVLPWLQMEH